ncbi:hypothetical protein [Acidimicrobium ferrooxidans]|nr:hypothetical protein [Acidimicrobium ferrooxidans]
MARQLTAPARWVSPNGDWDWIAGRLGPFGGGSITSVVPAGFGAYARILHPVEEPEADGRLVRWSDVARWAGTTLRPDAQFHSIAFPRVRPEAPAPWRSQGPARGRLARPDADALARLLREHTSTPEDCCFGLWDGYGFGGMLLAAPGAVPEPLPDPIPAAVREGPRLHLPERDYLCYVGPVEAISATRGLGRYQTANLAWPRDRAWFVASEIDLPWTYVAGSAALIDALLAEVHLEALPAVPTDPVVRVEPWVVDLVGRAAVELKEAGHVAIETTMGTVEAWLEHSRRGRSAAIRIESVCDDGTHGSHWMALREHQDPDVIRSVLEDAVVGLVEGS